MIFKYTDKQGRTHDRRFQWSLPVYSNGEWQAGDWSPRIEGDLTVCRNAYHGALGAQMLNWATDRLFIAEYMGSYSIAAYPDNNKVYGRQMRLLSEVTTWSKSTAHRFAIWCVRHEMDRLKCDSRIASDVLDCAEAHVNEGDTSKLADIRPSSCYKSVIERTLCCLAARVLVSDGFYAMASVSTALVGSKHLITSANAIADPIILERYCHLVEMLGIKFSCRGISC